MDMKPGYKQTEVGVIPEDWDVKAIGSISTIFGRIGFRGYTKNDIVKEGDGAMALNPSNVWRNKLILDKCTYITWQKYHESPEIKIEVGDLILVKTGSTTGKTCYVSHLPVAATLNPQMLVFKNVHADKRLLSYIFATPIFLNQIASTIVGGALPTLSQKQVEKYRIPLPSTLAEQEAIAEALSDADALIDSLEQLIAKKRLLKQGTMQDLLTEKRRLPGYEGGWVVKTLSQMAEIRGGGTPSTTQHKFWDGSIPWCTPTDITALQGAKKLGDTARKITKLGLASSSAELLPPNSVVMTSRATIGECAINERPVSTNQGFKNFVPCEDVDVDFLYYLLMTQKPGFIRLCAGSTFLEIGKTQLRDYEVSVPKTLSEQTAIAAVLSDMDADIAVLEAKLEKARQVKQGMMQELLTGRIRLV
jgi:type I restriction enzyme S subunit